MEHLYETMQRLLNNTTSSFLRYSYNDINWNNRMFGLVGPRGVGKTTLFLQRIKKEHGAHGALFVSADDIYFADHTLFGTAEALYKQGVKHFYIDEVHKYGRWSQELKAMYDSFPELHVYFTGSSVLDIEKGEADLSRRAPRYLMQGLSFREFLAMRYEVNIDALSLEDVLQNEPASQASTIPFPCSTSI